MRRRRGNTSTPSRAIKKYNGDDELLFQNAHHPRYGKNEYIYTARYINKSQRDNVYKKERKKNEYRNITNGAQPFRRVEEGEL